MTSMDEQILRASKEIIVKFIETGRVSPSGFSETFRSVYDAVAAAVKRQPEAETAPVDSKPDTK